MDVGNGLRQIAKMYSEKRDNPDRFRTFDPSGLAPTLNTCGGGGLEPHIGIKIIGTTKPHRHTNGSVYDGGGISSTVCHVNESPIYVNIDPNDCDVIGTYAINQSQDFVRGIFEEKSRTLKAEKHNVCAVLKALDVPNEDNTDIIVVKLTNGVTAYAKWSEKYNSYLIVRKLTPKECFRLQGWGDEYFERANLVNSDSQLYKQAGNGVTVDVVFEIGKRIAEIER